MTQIYRDWIMFSITALVFALVCVGAFRRDGRIKIPTAALCALLFAAASGAAPALCAEYLPELAAAAFALMLALGAGLFRLLMGGGYAGLRLCCIAGALCALCVLLAARAVSQLAAGAPETGYFSWWYPACAVPAGAAGAFLYTLIARRVEKTASPGPAEKWNSALLFTTCLLALLAEYSESPYRRIAAAAICTAGCYAFCAALAKRSALKAEAALAHDGELERIINMQRARYAELEGEIAEARQARHDLRFHMTAMRQYAESGDTRKIEEYLSENGFWQEGERTVWCANMALNSVARHYLGKAMEEGIKLDTAINIGETPGIPAPDLCVVLGNGLENALEAARKAPADKRMIRVRAEETPGWVTVVIGNSYSGKPLRAENRVYRSSKSEGRLGVGLNSIESIAEKSGGTAKFEAGEELFMTSVIMLKQTDAGGTETGV